MSFSKWILIATLVSATAHSRAQSHPEACPSNIPDSARVAAEQNYWTILEPHDLASDDIPIWKVSHPGYCPGVAVGNFYPKANSSSYLVALIHRDGQSLQEELVLVTFKKDRTATEIVVPPAPVAVPFVVWKVPRGRYLGLDGRKTSIPQDSFVFEKLIGSATQFYYQGSHLHSFVISK